MTEHKLGLGNYMGIAVVVALNLALFRGAMHMLTIPAIGALLVLLDVVLARLLIWRRPLRSSDYGFLATGFVATILTFPYNNDPHILRGIIGLYRGATGDSRIFKFNNAASFVYAERATLGVGLLAISLIGGALAGWGRRRSRSRGGGADRLTSPDA